MKTSEAYFCQISICSEEDQREKAKNALEFFLPILNKYSDIFKESSSLPPLRNQDHHIHLQSGAQLVSLRPYRYPQFQKTEMEKLIQEMLKQCIIRTSTNPYSSPVILVKKKMVAIDYVWITGHSMPSPSRKNSPSLPLMSCWGN